MSELVELFTERSIAASSVRSETILDRFIERIEERLGPGSAERNPQLIGQLMVTTGLGFIGEMLAEVVVAIYEIAEAEISEMTDAIRAITGGTNEMWQKFRSDDSNLLKAARRMQAANASSDPNDD
jgi:hypothetical protein